MAQGDLPRIHGSGWKPSAPLTFVAPLVADAARAELLRFIAERHEGLLPVAVDAWASSVDGADVFDGPAWHAFSETFMEAFAVRAAEQEGTSKASTLQRRSSLEGTQTFTSGVG